MQRAVDDALLTLRSEDLPPQLGELAYCTPSYVLMEAGACWLRVGRPHRAVEHLERGLAEWPAALVRDRTLCLSRLALAQAEAANLEQACSVAREAVYTARGTSSARVNLELRRLSRRLASYRGLTVVSELRDELRELA
jgi:predicted metal-dependent phosphoesterase TrpH